MPLRCREGERHPQPLHSTPGTPACGDPAPDVGANYLQQGWVLQTREDNVLQGMNNRVSCCLPFVVGPAFNCPRGIRSQTVGEDLGKEGLRRRGGGKDEGAEKVERMGWR